MVRDSTSMMRFRTSHASGPHVNFPETAGAVETPTAPPEPAFRLETAVVQPDELALQLINESTFGFGVADRTARLTCRRV